MLSLAPSEPPADDSEAGRQSVLQTDYDVRSASCFAPGAEGSLGARDSKRHTPTRASCYLFPFLQKRKSHVYRDASLVI